MIFKGEFHFLKGPWQIDHGIYGQHKLDHMDVNNKILAQNWVDIEKAVDLERVGEQDEHNKTAMYKTV